MSTIEIKSKIDIEQIITKLQQLDMDTLDYVVTSLQQEQAMRKKMKDEQFWALIDKIDWSQSQDEAKLQPVIEALSKLPVIKIYQFSESLAGLLNQLDGPEFIRPLEEDPSGYSADTFLYARCFVVAKGRDFYESVLSKTTPLPTKYLEPLLYVASQAYEQQTGKKYSYIPSTVYESFFNKTLWGAAAIQF